MSRRRWRRSATRVDAASHAASHFTEEVPQEAGAHRMLWCPERTMQGCDVRRIPHAYVHSCSAQPRADCVLVSLQMKLRAGSANARSLSMPSQVKGSWLAGFSFPPSTNKHPQLKHSQSARYQNPVSILHSGGQEKHGKEREDEE